jgi:GPI-anchor transamidase subunit U
MPTAAFALAVASYLSLHPAFLLPPIALLCYDQFCQRQSSAEEDPSPNSKDSKVAIDQRTLPPSIPFAIQFVVVFIATFTLLISLSRVLLPSWQFIPSVYLTPLQLPDLTPNPGLWWYFFIEMFDAFRSFFLGVFWLHMLSYSVPLCLRLRKQPLAATVLMMGINAIFEPYANVGDVGTWLSCLCLLGHVFERK